MSISMSLNRLKGAAEYSRNSNATSLKYLKPLSMHLSEAEPQRRRRRKKSRIVNSSRNVLVMLNEQGVTFSEIAKSEGPQKTELPSNNKSYDDLSTIFLDDCLENAKYSSFSLNRKDSNGAQEKLVNKCANGSILPYLQETRGIGQTRSGSQRQSDCSINLNFSGRRKRNDSNFSENAPRSEFDVLETSSYYDLDSKLEYSQDGTEIVCTDQDEETLPPYHQIVPEMFYRFAGISQYSDSTTKQSKGDFEKLLKCLAMESLLEEFLVWFPKPKLIKPGNGYISFDMFREIFFCKFAQTILEARWQYETLCTAILTMKCLDKHKLNRIEFVQFLQLYQSLYGNEVKVKDVRTVFDKYDADGIGQLTIFDMFNFCADEDADEPN
jgi:hypothetical protein